jgi:hypothetical protein
MPSRFVACYLALCHQRFGKSSARGGISSRLTVVNIVDDAQLAAGLEHSVYFLKSLFLGKPSVVNTGKQQPRTARRPYQ